MVNQPTPRTGGSYSKNLMRVPVVASGVLAALVLVLGVLGLANGDSNAVTMIIIGVAIALLLTFGIPYSRRRDRM